MSKFYFELVILQDKKDEVSTFNLGYGFAGLGKNYILKTSRFQIRYGIIWVV